MEQGYPHIFLEHLEEEEKGAGEGGRGSLRKIEDFQSHLTKIETVEYIYLSIP